MIIALVFAAIVAILLCLPVCADISYLLYKEESRLLLKVGIIKPFAAVYQSGKKENKAPGKEEKKPLKKDISLENIKDIMSEAAELFSYFKKRLKIVRFKLHFHIGTDDAAKTGIATGAAWGALYDVAAVLEQNFTLKEKNIHVCPNFSRQVFETDINIRLSIRLINLLIFAVKTYSALKKLNLERK